MGSSGRGRTSIPRRYAGPVRADVTERVDPSSALLWPSSVPQSEDDVHELLEPTPKANGIPSVVVILRGLTRVERLVVRMHVLEGESFSACGAAAGITRQGACRAYHRALAKMRGRKRLQRFAE